MLRISKKRTPQVSVVLTTYNRAKYLPRAIASILSQTFTDFELIIVNDGSTDDTRKVLATYVKKDVRIKVIHQKNKGLGQAQNEGVRRANGIYIAFMDDDDRSMPTRLDEQLRFLHQQPDLAACVCYYYEVTKTNDKIQTKHLNKHPELGMALTKSQLKNTPMHPFVLSSMTMIAKEAFEICGGYRSFFKVNEDLDFTLRFQEKFRAGVVRQPLYEYTKPDSQFGTNMTTGKLSQTLKYYLACYVSAWYRRNKHMDPVDQGADLAEIMDMIIQLPKSIRLQLIDYCLGYQIEILLNNPKLTIAELSEVLKILHKLDPGKDLRFLYTSKSRLFFIFVKQGKIVALLLLMGYALKRLTAPRLKKS